MNPSNETSEQEKTSISTASGASQSSGEENVSNTASAASSASQSLQTSMNTSEAMSEAESAGSVPSDVVRSDQDISSAGSAVPSYESSPEYTFNITVPVRRPGPGKGKGLFIRDQVNIQFSFPRRPDVAQHGKVVLEDPKSASSLLTESPPQEGNASESTAAFCGRSQESNASRLIEEDKFVSSLLAISHPQEGNASGSIAAENSVSSLFACEDSQQVFEQQGKNKKQKHDHKPEDHFVSTILQRTRDCRTESEIFLDKLLHKEDDGDDVTDSENAVSLENLV